MSILIKMIEKIDSFPYGYSVVISDETHEKTLIRSMPLFLVPIAVLSKQAMVSQLA